MKPIYPTNNSDRNISSTDKTATGSTNPFGKKDSTQQHKQNPNKNLGGMKNDNLKQSPGQKKQSPSLE